MELIKGKTMKECTTCEKPKVANQFAKNVNVCRVCSNLAQKEKVAAANAPRDQKANMLTMSWAAIGASSR